MRTAIAMPDRPMLRNAVIVLPLYISDRQQSMNSPPKIPCQNSRVGTSRFIRRVKYPVVLKAIAEAATNSDPYRAPLSWPSCIGSSDCLAES